MIYVKKYIIIQLTTQNAETAWNMAREESFHLLYDNWPGERYLRTHIYLCLCFGSINSILYHHAETSLEYISYFAHPLLYIYIFLSDVPQSDCMHWSWNHSKTAISCQLTSKISKILNSKLSRIKEVLSNM